MATLILGTRVGPYEIVSAVGAGGMGEVYKARDTRLDRTVALKVLPPQVGCDAASRERFQREARAIAALNHPHICTLHDVGCHEGIDFLVMEYLEGETLAARLAKGPLEIHDAVAVAIQVAEALDRAHRAGIVHRDIKPQNVMLAKTGTGGTRARHVKLLDFGIATASAPRVSSSARVTREVGLTAEGTIVGTVQYMAPEYLEGKEADARTDIYAFGIVVYEMVTGQQAFRGASHAALIAAILDSQPARLSTLTPGVPAFLDHLVQRCLVKDPDERWQSIRDVKIALETPADVRPALPDTRPAAPWRAWHWLGWVVALGVLLALVAEVLVDLTPDGQDTLATRLSILPPEHTTFLGGYSAPHLALSPDGRRLAFVPTPLGGRALLWIRALDSLSNTPVEGTDGATFPFWSPDGHQLAFFADGKLKTIDLKGGPPHVICDAPDARGGAWGADNVIVFTPQLVGPLYQVAASGGDPIAATTLEPARQDISHRLPSFLPDGRHFLFLAQSGAQATSTVRLGSIASPNTQPLDITGTEALYAQGFLLFRRDGSLTAQPFDVTTLTLTGEPVALGDPVAARDTVYGDAVFSVAENGTLAYWHGGPLLTNVTWFDRQGRSLGTLASGNGHYSLALSPDERTVVIEMTDDVNQIGNLWMVDLASGIKSRFTSGSPNWGALWSPDGRRVVFGSLRDGPSSLYEKPTVGRGSEQLFFKVPEFIGVTDWSSDGDSILIQNLTTFRLAVLPVRGDRTAKPLLQSEFVEGDGRWSPDRRWVAYTSNESGTWDVYVQPYPALDRKWRISPSGGSRPRWRADGKELFYVGPDQRLMAVPVTAASEFHSGPPSPLFQLRMIPLPPTQPRQQYAVTAKGDRFLVNTVIEAPTPAPVTVVLNWRAALKH